MNWGNAVWDFRRKLLCKHEIKMTKVWSISTSCESYFQKVKNLLEVKCDTASLFNTSEMSIYIYILNHWEHCAKTTLFFPSRHVIFLFRVTAKMTTSVALEPPFYLLQSAVGPLEPRSSLLGPAVGPLELRHSLLWQSACLLCLPSASTGTASSTVHSHRFWHSLSPKTFSVCGAPGSVCPPPLQGCSRPSLEDSWRWRGVWEVVAQGKGCHWHGAHDLAGALDWGRPEEDLQKNGRVSQRIHVLGGNHVQAPGFLWRLCSCRGCEHVEGNVKTLKSCIVLQSFLNETRHHYNETMPPDGQVQYC